MEAPTLTAAAACVQRRYAEGNARLTTPPSASLLRMQAAYVAYVDAYGRRYPDEAHLLPDGYKGRFLRQFQEFVTARAIYEEDR